ncbi:MAG: aquaporin [Nanoarchaeota archaeon]
MALKSYFAELLGTFILVFIGTGSIVTALSIGKGLTVPGILLIGLTFGFTLAVIIYALGNISGAHVNPAVSIAVVIAGKLKARHLIPYIIMQFIGATLASFFIVIIVGASFGIGENTIGSFGLLSALVAETVLTALFVIVILMTAESDYSGIAIGFFLAVSHLFAIPISGSSLNPARSFGPAIVIGGQALNQLWIYFIGPIIGAIFGALIFIAFFKSS